MTELMAVPLPLELGQQFFPGARVFARHYVQEPPEQRLVFRQTLGDLGEFPPLGNRGLVLRFAGLAAKLEADEHTVLAAKPAADQPAVLQQSQSAQFGLELVCILRSKCLGRPGKRSLIGRELPDGLAGLLQFE